MTNHTTSTTGGSEEQLFQFELHKLTEKARQLMPSESLDITEVMRLYREATAEAEKRAQRDLDHLVHVMETGQELADMYAKYDGHMDWREFVQTRYVDELDRLDSLTPPTATGGEHERRV